MEAAAPIRQAVANLMILILGLSFCFVLSYSLSKIPGFYSLGKANSEYVVKLENKI